MGKQQNPFAIATAKAKEMGYSDFSEGSEGNTKRGEIAEAIKEQKMKKQYEDLEEKGEKRKKEIQIILDNTMLREARFYYYKYFDIIN